MNALAILSETNGSWNKEQLYSATKAGLRPSAGVCVDERLATVDRRAKNRGRSDNDKKRCHVGMFDWQVWSRLFESFSHEATKAL
jgi:hypothetical protein